MFCAFNTSAASAILAVAASTVVTSTASAAVFYWDSNGPTSGFGTAGGTWAETGTTQDSTQGWSTDSTGATLPATPPLVITATTDDLNFGTSTAALGGGTITVSGTVNSGDMTFGSTSGEVVLSGGKINYVAGPTVTVSNSAATGTIEGVLSIASSGLTKGGSGTLRLLNTANTYTGGTVVQQGILEVKKLSNFGSASSLGSPASGNSLHIQLGNGGALGTLNYTGTGDSSNRTFAIGSNTSGSTGTNGSARINANGTAALILSASLFNALENNVSVARSLSLGGTGVGAINGSIRNNSSAGIVNVLKDGAGTWILAGGTAGNTYTGTTTVSAGTLQLARQVALYNNTAASWTATNIDVRSGATLALNVGGSNEFDAGNVQTIAALGTATGGFRSGSFLGLDTTNASGGSFAYGSAIANPNGGSNVRGLTKLGTHALVLSGNNTYTGGTTISGGELRANNSTSSTGTGAVTVGDGTNAATLGGNGTIANGSNAITVSNNATITAGADSSTTGKLTTGTQAWKAGGTYSWKIASPTPGGAGAVGGWDQLAMTTLNVSALSAGNQFKIVAIGMGAMTLQTGDSFQIATYTGTNGSPVASMFVLDVSQLVSQTSNADSISNYSLNFNDSGISLSYSDTQAAPEPGVAALVGLAGVSILGRRRVRAGTRRISTDAAA